MATEKANVTGVANSHLASECISALAECSSVNGCFTPKGVVVTDKCVEFMSKHISNVSCLSQGLGVARPKG